MASIQQIGGGFGDGFIGIGGGPAAPKWPTVGGPEMGGGVLGFPDIKITPGKNGGSTAAVSPGTGAFAAASSIIGCVTTPGTCLLRIVFLILGLICVAGAIYLYKPTSELVAAPVRGVRDAVAGAAVAA